MRKTDLVESVSKSTGLSARQADEVVSSMIEQITNALSRGESFSLVGFGSFGVKARAARMGKHPKTGEPINIAASNNVYFKPGKDLRDSCR